VAVLVLLWLLFEVSEIKEQYRAHDQSLVFLSGVSGEVDSEVISFRHHSLGTTGASLLEGGDDFTRRSLDIEVDGFTALQRTLTMHTDLHAATVDDVLQVVVLVVDLVDDIAACPWVNDLTNILILAIFNVSDSHFGSVEAVEGALARSVNEQEWFIVKFFSIILKVDLEGERLAVRGHALLGTETGFFLSLEEFFSLLFTILAQGEDLVGVVLVTTSEGFSKIELLLDEDTISGVESFETLLGLLDWGDLISTWWEACWGISSGGIASWGISLWGILLGRVLLGRILLGRILLRRILLGRVLLGWVSLLLGIATELDLDSLGLRLHYS